MVGTLWVTQQKWHFPNMSLSQRMRGWRIINLLWFYQEPWNKNYNEKERKRARKDREKLSCLSNFHLKELKLNYSLKYLVLVKTLEAMIYWNGCKHGQLTRAVLWRQRWTCYMCNCISCAKKKKAYIAIFSIFWLHILLPYCDQSLAGSIDLKWSVTLQGIFDNALLL